MPHFNRLTEKYPEEELVVLGISRESRDIIEPFLDEHDVRFQTASANDLPPPYSATRGIPTTFFIDRNGVIQTVLMGYRGYDVLEAHALAEDYIGESRRSPLESDEG